MARRQETDTQDLLGVAAPSLGFNADTGPHAGPRLRLQSKKAAAGDARGAHALGVPSGDALNPAARPCGERRRNLATARRLRLVTLGARAALRSSRSQLSLVRQGTEIFAHVQRPCSSVDRTAQSFIERNNRFRLSDIPLVTRLAHPLGASGNAFRKGQTS